MSRVPIEALSERHPVMGAYLVSHKQMATTKAGKPYLIVKLQDRTGQMDGRIWENAEAISYQFEQGQVADVRGVIESYNGRLQMRLDDLRRVPDEEVDPAEFLPTTRYEVAEMWDRLLAIVGEMKDPHVRGLLQEILTEPGFERLFKRAPAAKGIHHPWIGGLLEHVLSVAQLAKRVCPHYPHIDEDQVLFGAIMHDMGKVWELTYETSLGYSDEGRLVGHLVMGVLATDRAVARRKDFPPELALRLKHVLIAHHGTYEYGSPKLPQTLEAELVHRLDDLDSKITAISEMVLCRPSGAEPSWTEYNPPLGRAFFRGRGEPPSWPERMVELPVEAAPAHAPAKGTKERGKANLDLFGSKKK